MNHLPQVIFSDFDGTLTCGSELTNHFFKILNLVKKNNIPLIIVTGRSVSWAHFLLTHFSSLEYVIAEGGGVLVRRGKGDDLLNEFLVPKSDLKSLKDFSDDLLNNFVGLSLSADSLGRVADRAIELAEFNLSTDLKLQVEEYMKSKFINFSTSSVHLNFWKGELSKYKACVYLLEKYYPEIKIDHTLFFGDSLNDESMFKDMKFSVGVSNIKDSLSKLEYTPKVILEGEENIGANGVYNHLLNILK